MRQNLPKVPSAQGKSQPAVAAVMPRGAETAALATREQNWNTARSTGGRAKVSAKGIPRTALDAGESAPTRGAGPPLGSDRFSDIRKGEWYDEAVGELSAGDDPVLQGNPDGTFNPQGQLNQAECLTILCKVNGIAPAQASPDEAWFAPHMKAGESAWVASGDPAHVMTRGEVAYQAMSLRCTAPFFPIVFPFTDIEPEHPQFGWLMAAAQAGVFSGDAASRTIRPDDTLNRAEMAVITSRLKSGSGGGKLVLLDETEAKMLLSNALYDLQTLDAEALYGVGIYQVAKGVRSGAMSDGFESLLNDVQTNWNDLAGFRAAVTKDMKDRAASGDLSFLPDQVRRDVEQARLDLPDKADTPEKQSHLGSALHRLYGKVVELLTGSILSAEDAMVLNPSGGIVGPEFDKVYESVSVQQAGDRYQRTDSTAAREKALRAAITRHGIVHDALGFLHTRYGVGPGYYVKNPDEPMAGQIQGILHSALHGIDADFQRLVDEVLAEPDIAAASMAPAGGGRGL